MSDAADLPIPGLAAAFGEGRLSLSASGPTASGPAGTAMLSLSAADSAHGADSASVAAGVAAITLTAYGSAEVLSHVHLGAAGVVESGGPLAQAWQWVLALPTDALFVLYGWLVQEIQQALSDPKTFGFTIVVTLPFLALVLRRLNLRK